VDWDQLKSLHGGADVNSTSPLAERQRLLLAIAQAEAAPLPLGLDRLTIWSDTWGWDNTDLEWEARIYGTLAVLRFGKHWDARTFHDALIKLGYRARAFEGGVAYDPDPAAEVPWQARFANIHGLGIHGPAVTEPMVRVAISDDGRTVLLSRTADPGARLRAGLEADRAAVAASAFGRAAAALGRPVAASLIHGREACSEETNAWLHGEARAIAASVAPLHPYEALAAGYTRADEATPPTGRYVFAYAGAQQARDDLSGRQRLIEKGYQYNDDTSRYEDVAFSLTRAHVTGSRLVLDVAPVGGEPVHVLRNMRIRPALFATCGRLPGSPAA
jgi:hypothetical protein